MKTSTVMKGVANVLLLSLPALIGAQALAQQPATQTASPAPAHKHAHKHTAAAPKAEAPVAADAKRLIPLQGVLNVRDFAGLKGRHGVIPATAFIRTADLGRATAADRDTLARRGVTLDVDLRTAEEEQTSRDALADDARFKYTRISLLGTEKIDMSHMPATLGELYAQALDVSQPQFSQVMQAIAAQEHGTVLFHCTAGKDRTGMISALLLSLAGVPRKDIVHNYAISAHYLKPMMSGPQIAAQIKANPQVAGLMGTPRGAMEAFLDKLDTQYGGADAYLKKIGVSDEDVRRLLVRLGQH